MLDISYNRISSIPEGIKNMTSLQFLAMACNKITRLPLAFGEMSRLYKLDVDKNPLEFPPMDTLMDLQERVGSSIESEQERVCDLAKRFLKVPALKPRPQANPEEGMRPYHSTRNLELPHQQVAHDDKGSDTATSSPSPRPDSSPRSHVGSSGISTITKRVLGVHPPNPGPGPTLQQAHARTSSSTPYDRQDAPLHASVASDAARDRVLNITTNKIPRQGKGSSSACNPHDLSRRNDIYIHVTAANANDEGHLVDSRFNVTITTHGGVCYALQRSTVYFDYLRQSFVQDYPLAELLRQSLDWRKWENGDFQAPLLRFDNGSYAIVLFGSRTYFSTQGMQEFIEAQSIGTVLASSARIVARLDGHVSKSLSEPLHVQRELLYSGSSLAQDVPVEPEAKPKAPSENFSHPQDKCVRLQHERSDAQVAIPLQPPCYREYMWTAMPTAGSAYLFYNSVGRKSTIVCCGHPPIWMYCKNRCD
ncbi:RAM signaling network component [Elasticomyces elasticus]|nr:RAM signaling network component [Elasticomyces elasticus]KAK3662129.1 RAM signaling network component [Elasticomyces elasticus]